MEKQFNSRINKRIENFNKSFAERKQQLYENECGLGTTEMKVRSKYNMLETKANLMINDGWITDTLLKGGAISWALAIPPIAVSAYHFLSITTNGYALGANAGYVNTEETTKILNNISMNIDSHLEKIQTSGSLALGAVSIGTISLIAAYIADICTKKYNEIQSKKQQPIIDEMIVLDDILTMMKDLRSQKPDFSLNFIKDFLSSTDLTENTYGFNYELLSRLAKYRTNILKSMNNEEITQEEIDKSFISIVNFLNENATLKGASNNFINNGYVKELIETYTKSDNYEEIEKEEPLKTKRRRRS